MDTCVSNESIFTIARKLWSDWNSADLVYQKKAVALLKGQYQDDAWLEQHVKPVTVVDGTEELKWVAVSGRMPSNWAIQCKATTDEIYSIVGQLMPSLMRTIKEAYGRLRVASALTGDKTENLFGLILRDNRELKKQLVNPPLKLNAGGFNFVEIKDRRTLDKYLDPVSNGKTNTLNVNQIKDLAVSLLDAIEKYRNLRKAYAQSGIHDYNRTLSMLKAKNPTFAGLAAVTHVDIKTSPLPVRVLEKQIEAYTWLIKSSLSE